MQKYQKNRSSPKHLDPKCLTFSIFTTEDVINLSVIKIRTPLSFNILGHPLKGGLYDPALGPLLESSDPCATCGSTVFKCPGHFGHIELPMPVVNPLFHKALSMLIKLSCLNCFTLQIPTHIKMLLCGKLKILEMGLLSDIDGLEDEITSAKTKSQDIHESDLVYIKDIIETYIRNLVNKARHLPSSRTNGIHLNTKNVNAQWHLYVDSVLKQYNAGKICINCQEAIPKITILRNKIMTTKVNDANFATTNIKSHTVVNKLETIIVMPDQSKEYLRKLWANEKEFLKVIIPCLNNVNTEYATDVFFFDVVPVLPPIVRPINFLHGQMIEHPQSQVYKSIIQDCLILRNIIQSIQDGNTSRLPEEGRMVFEQIKGGTPVEKLHNAWQSLQTDIDHLMDRELNKTPDSANCHGLKQVIEKKEGIIRMHMMGKRVNYAARSVITPDPNLDIDEIGIPETFALKLTYPIPVTPWNLLELRQLVLNGPNIHPGAVIIENEDGSVQRLNPYDITKREAIAKRLLPSSDKANRFFNGIKIVHRHLQNGDMLLVNRQPTLHKPSIMAHKARILKGEKTLRLHYANCKAYNADFDGDECNVHFPQNELARSEGYLIANVSNQYLVPKDGTPLSGLIQDHVISGVRLTMRGKFFSRTDYMQLLYCALVGHKGDLKLLPPTILKPFPLWSGKQIISSILINITPPNTARINLKSRAKINVKQWQRRPSRRWKCGGKEFKYPEEMSEAEVIVRNGELLCGVLDKTHYGATPYGLVHCVYELYGGPCSSKLLSAFGKLFQAFLQRDGFTLGIEDILIVPRADVKRKEIISECRKLGEDVQRAILDMADDTPTDVILSRAEESYRTEPKFRAQVDRKYKNVLDVYTNDINRTCLPAGLLKKFPHNNLQLMVLSGAKGSMVNTMQISCLLGQIELEGKRPPLMISGKSLPSFSPYDPTPRAGGFVDGRFMTGIKPQEFFFHCMAGREGLIDTAVKTSRSGYLQRCLIKHLEGLVVDYDSTVRDSDGSLIQIYYGEDGLDVTASTFLKKDHMDFLVDNKNVIVDPNLVTYLKEETNYQSTLRSIRKIKKWTKKNGGRTLSKVRRNEFSIFTADNYNPASSKFKRIDENSGRSKGTLSLIRKWIRMDEETKKSYKKQCIRCPDPLTSKFRQDIEFGVLSERLEMLMDEYVTSDNKSFDMSFATAMDKAELRDLLSMKVMKSICPPGEPVGLLAAQSIGEPSTQMTLNTFHHAGRGEMNVTLGIPRLREILMMASRTIKTPTMEIPFKKDLQNLTKRSNKLRQKLTKCIMTDVLKDIKIDKEMEHFPHRRLLHTLHIEFLPYKCYKSEFSVSPQGIIEKTEQIFFKALFKEIKKIAKVTGTLIHVEDEKKRGNNEDKELDEEETDDEPKKASKLTNVKRDLGEQHESSDEEEAAEDADATVTRTISRHQENQEYEGDTEDEVEDGNEKDDDDDIKEMMPPRESSNNDVEERDDDDDWSSGRSYDANDKHKKCNNDIVNAYTYALEYECDQVKSLWCKLKFWLPLKMTKIDLPTIIRNVAGKVILWETPDIRRAFTIESSDGETILKTDGINIIEMFKYNEVLDLPRLYSNDIYGISQTYGIEAANKVIIREVKDVFKMYGITVDSRHLSLIADYMTFDGTFQPLSRKGMNDSASPLQQMSFESSLNFLRNAILRRKQDDLKSPSGRLMLGQPCRSGTGACSLLTKIL